MSGDMANVSLEPVVTALQAAVTGTDIVTLFATGVSVSVAIVLVWFRLQVGIWQIYPCCQTVGRG